MEDTIPNPTAKRCAVVTGGNKGIGFEICRQLASNQINVLLTARDENRGKRAVEDLKDSGVSDVVFHQLDVKDPASIASLAKFVETNYGKLDILVNNAAEPGVIIDPEAFKIFIDGAGFIQDFDASAHFLKYTIKQTHEMAVECLKTNYYGAKRVTEALLPLLQFSSSARIVNVSSDLGELQHIKNDKLKAELNDVEVLTEGKIDEILQQYLRDFKDDKLEANGWPLSISAYKVSKVAMNAYTRLMARKFPKFLINCVHPGFVKTDITYNTGFLTAEEGARAPVMAALLPNDGPSAMTGGNKGIGLEICGELASNGISLILTARDEYRGKKAAEDLKILVCHVLSVKHSSTSIA